MRPVALLRRCVGPAALVLGLSVLAGASCSGDPARIDAIGSIQGRGHTSPRVDRIVTIQGIVTARHDDGFIVQAATGDDDPATSDAIAVTALEAAAVGSMVTVTGRVAEVVPGGRATNLTTTTLVDASWKVESSAHALPAPTALGRGGRALPDRVIDDDAMQSFDPDADGLDFFESLESMRVQVNDAVVCGPTNRHGEVWVLADGGRDASGRNARGGVTIGADDFNPERLQIDDTWMGAAMPSLAVGDRLESFVGIVHYAYGNYEILPQDRLDFARRERKPVVAALTPQDGALTVATFNVLNLGGDEDDDAFDARAMVIVESLHSPALVALQEIQDDDGATDSGSSAAAGTFARLVDAIVRAGGPRYEVVQLDPIDGADGGEPGGNIRVGYLFDPARLAFDAIDGSRDEATIVDVDGTPRLVANPARLGTHDPAFADSRKPLVAAFDWRGDTVFAINVHLSSKGGSTPLFGATRPPVNGRLQARTDQAERIRRLVDAIVAVDASARILVLGDFNEFDFNVPIARMIDGGPLRCLTRDLPPAARTSYVYQGNAQALDHILVAGFDQAEVEPVPACSPYPDGASDHDPVLARLR